MEEEIVRLRKMVYHMFLASVLLAAVLVTSCLQLVNARHERQAVEFYYRAALMSWVKQNLPGMGPEEQAQLEEVVKLSRPKVFNLGKPNQVLDFGFKKENGSWKVGFSTVEKT